MSSPNSKSVVIVGSGLGSLATALRLSTLGYDVTILEKFSQAGGRLNQIVLGDFKFDIGPSFMSMSYELDELFQSCGLKNPVQLEPLEPLYQVFFENNPRPYQIWKDLSKLEKEFAAIEPGLAPKVEKYLKRAQQFFEDTDSVVIKTNFYGYGDYLKKLLRVPMKHLPYLFKNMWQEVETHFSSNEMRMIFSLVAFFLGSTPFKTSAIYSLLNYIEFRHNGYWRVQGGMYKVVEELVRILKERGVKFYFNTEVKEVIGQNRVECVVDQNHKKWTADIFVCNADAASFRGLVLNRPSFRPEKLDKMEWSLAPFTIYLGVKGKIPQLGYHNYFLRNNFQEYAKKIFVSPTSPEKPYYYVNVASKLIEDCAPRDCENVFILCPVADLRFKADWSDKESLADSIIQDLSKRIGFDVSRQTLVRKVLSPPDWGEAFNLYQGSGLGLCHGIFQIGIFRPKNKDEKFNNLYYVGASTIPGTGLPMAIIGSRLITQRIQNEQRFLS